MNEFQPTAQAATNVVLRIDTCRRQRPYSRGEYAARVLWALAWPLFRLSPRPFFGWRRLLLRLFGARIGAGANVYPSARIVLPWNLDLGADASIGEWALVYNLGPVMIGARATVSHRAHLCAGTHDPRDPTMELQRKALAVGAQAWVCADAFIGPGVTVGEGAVVGAAAVAVRDVPAWHVVAGNPAQVVGKRELRP